MKDNETERNWITWKKEKKVILIWFIQESKYINIYI